MSYKRVATPKTVIMVWRFHRVTTFAITDSFGILVPSWLFIECTKKEKFHWGENTKHGIMVTKEKCSTMSVLALLSFEKVFMVVCDISGAKNYSILRNTFNVFFSEKLSNAHRKWSTYNQEFYAVV